MAHVTFTEQLRAAVRNCGITRYRISRQTGIDQGTLCRFVHGDCWLRSRNLDRLAALLGLDVVVQARGSTRC
jgi:hypothetical protein